MWKVSVVIPSYRRHEEVIRAVRSALSQTLPPTEVIVVNDGPDQVKAQLLQDLQDARVKYVEAPRRGRASATRNFGISEARGQWIALLDDDDVWLPNKLEAQFATLAAAGQCEAILGGVEEVVETSGRTHLRPAAANSAPVAVDVFLFGGTGGLNTSTLLAPRQSFIETPLDESLKRHEDWQWLLDVGQRLPLLICSEVVCRRWLRPGEGLSRPGGFAFTRAWYERNRAVLSAEARSGFTSSVLSSKAAYDGDWLSVPWLLREAFSSGRMTPRRLAKLIQPWILPLSVRRQLKFWLGDFRRA